MANFKTHITVSTFVSATLSIGLLKVGVVDEYKSIVLLILGVVGELAPDIDSDSSIPLRYFFTLFSVIFAFIVMFCNSSYPILYMLFIWVASFIFSQVILFKVFVNLTDHRGIFHSIVMAFFLSFITVIVAYEFSVGSTFAYFCGLFVLVGVATHLILDEIFSVDVLNNRLKKSFGTALKFYYKNDIKASIFLYILTIALFFKLPKNYHKFIDIIINIYDKFFAYML